MIEMNRKSCCAAVFFLFGAVLNAGQHAQAQTTPQQTRLSVHWEELTGPDFIEAIKRAQGTCLLPFGIMEKHGPHMPIGSDLINARYTALHAAENQYAVVFPEYYFGQISEARHEPGTVAYTSRSTVGLAAGDDGRDGSQWLQEDPDRQWPRRKR